jgi:hypothetical protein
LLCSIPRYLFGSLELCLGFLRGDTCQHSQGIRLGVECACDLLAQRLGQRRVLSNQHLQQAQRLTDVILVVGCGNPQVVIASQGQQFLHFRDAQLRKLQVQAQLCLWVER